MSGTEDKYYSIALDAGSAERAEVESLREALERIPNEAQTVVIHTDSFYVWNFFHHTRLRRRIIGVITIYRMGVSLRNWIGKLERSNRWIKGVTCGKVKPHNGNIYNEKADTLALAGSRKIVPSLRNKEEKD